jgi:hypothetical protein
VRSCPISSLYDGTLAFYAEAPTSSTQNCNGELAVAVTAYALVLVASLPVWVTVALNSWGVVFPAPVSIIVEYVPPPKNLVVAAELDVITLNLPITVVVEDTVLAISIRK